MIFVVAILMFGFYYLPEEAPDPLAMDMMNKKRIEFADKIQNDRYCILIDYSKHIFQKRLWVFDMEQNTTVVHCHVSHALRSGIFFAEDLSNAQGSLKTPKGAFATGKTYHGKFGYSMRLYGLEDGINSNSFIRYITFHPVKNSIWSEGCFMTSEESSKKIIDLTKNGCFMYVYSQ
jgi:hypothetical protein